LGGSHVKVGINLHQQQPEIQLYLQPSKTFCCIFLLYL
jgi:hypothetical protein